MAMSKKSYIDLSGLTKFRDLLLKTTIDVDNDTSVGNKTASVSAILEYVSSVEASIINGVNTSLNSKVQSVGYASKKFTYTTSNGTTDIVSISTLKTDIGTMTGATASVDGAFGLVPAPTKGKQASFLRGDGTWAIPTDNNVTQSVNTSANSYPILASATANASKTTTTTSVFATGIKITPSTNTISASTFSGDLSGNATSATNATNDSDGKPISITYVKGTTIATSDNLGLVKSSPIGTDGKNYAVGVNLDGTMKVNIPWTDKNVTQTPSTSGSSYPILASATAGASTEGTTTSIFATGIKITPSTNTISATTFSGNATSATNATYATKIGTDAKHPSIGSETQPVYVNSNGVITVGTALGSMAYKETSDYLANTTRGAKNGVASLDENGLVPSSQLPSYVDDVLEYSAKSGNNGFPAKGETGKIYVDTSTNRTYRWSGSAYVEISESLALGETSSTAYAGDKGATLATNLSSHTGNTTVHITSAERTSWNGKEDKSNKVASWSSTTTDDHYPSEKLVKTALDTHTHKYAGSSDAGGSATSAVALTSKNIGSYTKPVYFDANGKPAAISYTIETSVPSDAVFTDSHYTAVPVLGASDSKANATTSNDATYLNIIENDAKSGGIQIKGSGATTVSATNGVLTISSTDNNNQVTQTVNSSENTYPILASATANASKTTTTTSVFATGIKITPSTNTITATTFSGNATSATNASKVGNCSVETSLSSSSNSNIPTSKAVADYITSIDPRTYENNFINKNMFSYASTVDKSSSAGSYTDGVVTMGDGTINVPNGGIVANSGIKGARVYNAVWNDLVDCIPVDDEVELEYGYCYSFDGERYHKSSEYMEQGVIGIHSDTAGMVMGSKPNTKELHCGVAGFCLAYVDKEYEVGTPLTCTEGGILTEIKHKDKVEYPERVIATYWKSESSETWGSDTEKVKVNGRRWVKIR